MMILSASADCPLCHGAGMVTVIQQTPHGPAPEETFPCDCGYTYATANEKDRIDNGEDWVIKPARAN